MLDNFPPLEARPGVREVRKSAGFRRLTIPLDRTPSCRVPAALSNRLGPYPPRRSNSRTTASRMNSARRFFPATASMRAIVSASKRTSVVLVSESRLSGGRPMRGAVSDAGISAIATLFPISLIDGVTDAAYISNIAYGGKNARN